MKVYGIRLNSFFYGLSFLFVSLSVNFNSYRKIDVTKDGVRA